MTPAELAAELTGPRPLWTQPLRHGLTAVLIPKSLSKREQAEVRVRLGARRPADLELLAREQRKARR